MWDKGKQFLADDMVFYSLLVLMVGVASFGLGKLSEQRPDLIIGQEAGTVTLQTGASSTENIYYVASQKGTKYHLPWCPGATQIKAENQLRFATKEVAEASGYSPAENCPGL